MARCPKCGAEHETAARFCPGCGARASGRGKHPRAIVVGIALLVCALLVLVALLRHRSRPVSSPEPEGRQTASTPRSQPGTNQPSDEGAAGTDARGDAYEFFDGQARASSVLRPGTGKFEAALALDGDPSTAWCWPPPAEGAAIVITFPSERLVERIEIIPGYDKVHSTYGSVWKLNNRVRQVEIEVADGRRIQAELEDAPRLQPALITPAARTNWCRIEIQSVYPGSKWRDSAISEIKIWGHETSQDSRPE